MGRYFAKETKRAAFEACKDQHGVARCPQCTAALRPGHYRFDHIVPWNISRDSSRENCQIACDACDARKTYGQDIPMLAKVKRIADRHIGAHQPRHPMPCGRRSKFRKTMDGRVVERVTLAQRMAALRERLP